MGARSERGQRRGGVARERLKKKGVVRSEVKAVLVVARWVGGQLCHACHTYMCACAFAFAMRTWERRRQVGELRSPDRRQGGEKRVFARDEVGLTQQNRKSKSTIHHIESYKLLRLVD